MLSQNKTMIMHTWSHVTGVPDAERAGPIYPVLREDERDTFRITYVEQSLWILSTTQLVAGSSPYISLSLHHKYVVYDFFVAFGELYILCSCTKMKQCT